jgi:hypothetical protein
VQPRAVAKAGEPHHNEPAEISISGGKGGLINPRSVSDCPIRFIVPNKPHLNRGYTVKRVVVEAAGWPILVAG